MSKTPSEYRCPACGHEGRIVKHTNDTRTCNKCGFNTKAIEFSRMQQYLRNKGVRCPVCSSDNINTSAPDCTVDADPNIAEASSTCDDCYAAWTDVYTLTGYKDLVAYEPPHPDGPPYIRNKKEKADDSR